jgi:TRAP-type C4-dicarboxylate transport system permease small subunit
VAAVDGTDPARGTARVQRDWIEIFSTLLLAMATVATAWSGYQATRWSGEQAIAFSAASALRVESGKASTRAGQQLQIDISLFTQWVDAYARKETFLRDFYFKRFRDEFRPAIEAWLATKPETNPKAPKSPFDMPQYRLAEQARADQLVVRAEAQTEIAKRNNQRSDNYVLCVVLFAASLFFAGISTKLVSPQSRAAILFLGYALFLGTLVWVASFPVSFSI